MKRKTIKPIIISALMAVSFGATAVGTTFALFTDRADTKIDVTAGVVDIETTVKMVSYTDGDLLHDNDVDLSGMTRYETPKVGTVFELVNGEKDLEITNMVPGDKITLEVSLKNFSNVNTKYRLVATNNAGELAKALKVTSTGGTTVWTELPAAPAEGKEIETAHVTIEFVNHDEGEILSREDAAARDNKFMGKKVTYHLGYEVVQGNANVVDSEPSGFNAYEEVVKPTAKVGETGYVWSKEVAGGAAKLSGETAYNTDITVSLDATEENGNFTFSDGSTTVSYDINVTRDSRDSSAVKVEVLLEKGLQSVIVYHEGTNGTEALENEYNPTTGYVTFETTSFSPYHFVQIPVGEARNYITTASELLTAAENGGKYYLSNNIDMKNDFVSVDKNFELFGMGHTIKTNASRALRVTTGDETNGRTLKLNDLNIVGGTATERGVQVDSNKPGLFTVELNNIDISNISYYAINICVGVSVDLKIKDSSITGYGAVNAWSEGYNITVENSYLKGINDKGYNAEGWNDFGTFILEGDTTGQTDLFADNNVCVIKNSTIVTDTTNGNNQYSVVFNAPEAHNKVTLEGCKFENYINGVLANKDCTVTYIGNNELIVK